MTQEIVSDASMVDLLSAIGNHEGKAILLCKMDTDKPKDAAALRSLIMDAQGDNPEWDFPSNLAFQYCQSSLYPIGLVAYEFDDETGTWGYARSRYGEAVGKPLVGLLLDYSRRHEDTSLYRILGSTHTFNPRTEGTSTPRAPETRLKIYWELVTSELPIRLADLEQSLGVDNKLITGHLNQLKRFGLIEYESSSSDKPVTYYKILSDTPSEQPPPFNRYLYPTRRVHELLDSDPGRQWSAPEIATILTNEKGFDSEVHVQKYLGNITHTISSILSHLRKQGYCEVQKFDKKNRSTINLSPRQRELLGEFIEIIDSFQNQDQAIIARGHLLADSLTQEDIRLLLYKARANSPVANRNSDIFTTQRELLSVIYLNPGISAMELKSQLEKDGKFLTEFWIRTILKNMQGDGIIHGEKEKKIIHWFINSN